MQTLIHWPVPPKLIAYDLIFWERIHASLALCARHRANTLYISSFSTFRLAVSSRLGRQNQKAAPDKAAAFSISTYLGRIPYYSIEYVLGKF
jgi:hypothetical protein